MVRAELFLQFVRKEIKGASYKAIVDWIVCLIEKIAGKKYSTVGFF
jgi:hypothetical protein